MLAHPLLGQILGRNNFGVGSQSDFTRAGYRNCCMERAGATLRSPQFQLLPNGHCRHDLVRRVTAGLLARPTLKFGGADGGMIDCVFNKPVESGVSARRDPGGNSTNLARNCEIESCLAKTNFGRVKQNLS